MIARADSIQSRYCPLVSMSATPLTLICAPVAQLLLCVDGHEPHGRPICKSVVLPVHKSWLHRWPVFRSKLPGWYRVVQVCAHSAAAGVHLVSCTSTCRTLVCTHQSSTRRQQRCTSQFMYVQVAQHTKQLYTCHTHTNTYFRLQANPAVGVHVSLMHQCLLCCR